MDLIHFKHVSGKSETLRPTHAMLISEALNKQIDVDESGYHVHAGSLAEAARQVRDRYRCRTVRKELRRVGLLGVEGVADRTQIQIECADAKILADMRQMSAAD